MIPRAAGEHRTLIVEAGHQHLDALTDAGEHVFFRHFTVVEEQRIGVGATHAELVEMLAVGEALKTLLDEEGGHAARARLRIGLGVDHEHVGIAAIGDPHFRTIEHIAVAALVGAQLHRDDVGPRAGLGHRERADIVAGDQLWQIALPLRVVAVAAYLVDAEVGMGAVGQPDRSRAPRNLFHGDDVGQIAHVGAAILLRRGHAEQAEVAKALPEVGREQIGFLDLGSARGDLRLDEGAHGVAQHADVFAQIEIDARDVQGESSEFLANFLSART